MNPEQLLAHFNRVADGPDSIARLRRFTLDLAVRGKLVEQDPNDEPASELLKRIRAEKARLVKAGKTKESRPLAIADMGKVRYGIPASWKWVPLGETVNQHVGGGTPSKNNSTYWDGDILWASVKDVGKGKYIDDTIDRITEAGLADSSSNLIPPGNLIVVTRMGLGKVSINRVPMAINQDLRALSLSTLTVIDYQYIFFKTHGFEGTGLTVKGIRVEELLNIPFPLPPLAEQHRIVAKVDELMALCDRLESAQAERESRRDKLAAATLHRLNKADDPQARLHAEFYLRHFPRLHTRLNQVALIRHAVLGLGFGGQLTKAWRETNAGAETSQDCLNAIRGAREASLDLTRATKAGHKHSAAMPFSSGDLPPIPAEWAWASADAVCRQITDGEHVQPRYQAEGLPMLTAKHVRDGYVTFEGCEFISELDFQKCAARCKPEQNDILIVSVGATTGRAAIVNNSRPFVLVRSVLLLKPLILAPFLLRWLQTQWCLSWMRQASEATAQPHLYIGDTKRMPVPIPSISEQHRIVAKVDELMALCDRLESQLTTAQTESRRLLEALLHEALASAA